MTIINHKYKFIFLKPSRVGGSSLQYGLLKSFGPADVGDLYDYEVTKELFWLPHKRVPIDSHATYDEILKVYPYANDYQVISIWRDEEERYDSSWRYYHARMHNSDVEAAVRETIEHDRYIWELPGIRLLRTEYLQRDYEVLCKEYGVVPMRPLPYFRSSHVD